MNSLHTRHKKRVTLLRQQTVQYRFLLPQKSCNIFFLTHSPQNNSIKDQTIVFLLIFIFVSELIIFGLKSFILNEAKKDFSFVEKNLKIFQLRQGFESPEICLVLVPFFSA